MKNKRKSIDLSGKWKPGAVFLPIKAALLSLMISLLFSSCFNLFDDGDGPTDVHWKGKVIDKVSKHPLPGQLVKLRRNHYNGDDPFLGYIIREDVFQTTVTDSLGRFEFRYYDPDDKGWYTAETTHPDYFFGLAGGDYWSPTEKDLRLDIKMKPKAWLKIRVFDDPQKESGVSVVKFRGLYDSLGFQPIRFIYVPNSDSTFLAHIEGGEKVFFEYKADSTGYVKYEATFPPLDTTELTFSF